MSSSLGRSLSPETVLLELETAEDAVDAVEETVPLQAATAVLKTKAIPSGAKIQVGMSFPYVFGGG